MFWGFPQRLRLQRWLSENQVQGAQKAGAGRCFRTLNAPREPIFCVRTHFSSQSRTNSVLTQIRILRRVKYQLWLFWGPFSAHRASQHWRRNLWWKPQNISERSGWSGGVICHYFSSRNSWENLIFLKIVIFTICLLLPLFLDDPVVGWLVVQFCWRVSCLVILFQTDSKCTLMTTFAIVDADVKLGGKPYQLSSLWDQTTEIRLTESISSFRS